MATLFVYHGAAFTKYLGFYQTVTMKIVDGALHIFDRDVASGDETVKAIFKSWDRLDIEKSGS